MSGILPGIGAQSLPISQTFQPSRSVEARENRVVQQESDNLNRVNPDVTNVEDNGAVARARESSDENFAAAERRDDRGESSSSASGRGSVVNITV